MSAAKCGTVSRYPGYFARPSFRCPGYNVTLQIYKHAAQVLFTTRLLIWTSAAARPR